MKRLLTIVLIQAIVCISTRAQLLINGNFAQSVIAAPGSLTSPLNCPSTTAGWRMGSANGLPNPQITDYNQAGDTYIDLTPCGSMGNGSWIEQDVIITEECQYNFSFYVKPMNGKGEAAFWLFMDGKKIGPSCITSNNQEQWVRKNSVPFTIPVGKHTFRISTGCSSSSNQFNVIGVDNVSLNKIDDCNVTTTASCNCPTIDQSEVINMKRLTKPNANKVITASSYATVIIRGNSSWEISPGFRCGSTSESEGEIVACEKGATFAVTITYPDGQKKAFNSTKTLSFTPTQYGFYVFSITNLCANKKCTSYNVKIFVTPGCEGEEVQ